MNDICAWLWNCNHRTRKKRIRLWLWNLKRRMWQGPIRWWLWSLRSRWRYWLTGDCGNACEWAWLRDLRTGEREPVFIPEAECPIHDRE